MSNIAVILNVLIVLGMCVSALLAVHFEKLLSSVIALSITGIFHLWNHGKSCIIKSKEFLL